MLTLYCQECANLDRPDRVVGTVDSDRIWRASGTNFWESIDEPPTDGPGGSFRAGGGSKVPGVCPSCEQVFVLRKIELDQRVVAGQTTWLVSPNEAHVLEPSD